MINLKLVWDDILKNIEIVDFKGGFDLLKFTTKNYHAYPPTPGEFKELCFTAKRRRSAYESAPPKIKTASYDIQRKNINECWKHLGRKDKVKNIG